MVTHNGLIPHDNKITNIGVQESLEFIYFIIRYILLVLSWSRFCIRCWKNSSEIGVQLTHYHCL